MSFCLLFISVFGVHILFVHVCLKVFILFCCSLALFSPLLTHILSFITLHGLYTSEGCPWYQDSLSRPSPPLLTEAKCKSQAKADIILLVDGSWSIGRLNFKTIRAFIARIVGVFDISPERVMIGMVQYSGDPKTEWHLNAHPTRDGLLKAVADLPYKGGNTMTGMALNYILQNNFKPNVGLRKDSRKIGVLITDGKSQDEIITNSQVLRDENIELYAIGVKNADENELRSIASDPDEIHMYNVNDFSFLLDIVDELTINLCNSVKGPGGGMEPPTNLVTSEVTHHSFRATWTGPEGPVEKYRIEYMSVAGGITEQIIVDGTVTTVVLTKLTPLTEYVVNVFSVTGEETSAEPLKGTETTCKRCSCSAPSPSSPLLLSVCLPLRQFPHTTSSQLPRVNLEVTSYKGVQVQPIQYPYLDVELCKKSYSDRQEVY
ncbi:unnamed protein product [Oncorhynchus mykiss]|uniref:Collagen, type XII, alpha 1b n=1 Tax=Oncorhynchus mykiss TaxID=8022 RepID=A0A060WX52_ONCMY|nr:unnamed protein product [Oncorhynchus mykiss]